MKMGSNNTIGSFADMKHTIEKMYLDDSNQLVKEYFRYYQFLSSPSIVLAINFVINFAADATVVQKGDVGFIFL